MFCCPVGVELCCVGGLGDGCVVSGEASVGMAGEDSAVGVSIDEPVVLATVIVYCVMVVAEQAEVARVGCSTVGPGFDVVHLG